MKKSMKYDVVVIGAGPGGHRTGELTAQAGLKTLIIDKYRAGGNCVQNACMPTKALLASVKAYIKAKKAPALGVNPGSVSFDWSKINEHRLDTVNKITKGTENLMSSFNADFLISNAEISSKNTVETDDCIIEFKYLVIATGAEPSIPLIKNVDEMKAKGLIFDSTSIQEIKQLPKTLAIIGGGAIACEMAFIFSNLNVAVTIVETADHILPANDPDLSESMAKILGSSGNVKIIDKAKNLAFDAEKKELLIEGRPPITVEMVLVAAGRKPVVPKGIDLLEIKLDKRGYIETDETFCTVNPHVFAVGDITAKVQQTHVAYKCAAIVSKAIQGIKDEKVNYEAIPATIYTYPEVASVGLSEQKLKQANVPYLISSKPLMKSGRMICEGENTLPGGFAKLMVANDGKILGAAIVSPDASDQITIIAEAIEAGAKVDLIARTMIGHPTTGQMFHDLAIELRYKLTHHKF